MLNKQIKKYSWGIQWAVTLCSDTFYDVSATHIHRWTADGGENPLYGYANAQGDKL